MKLLSLVFLLSLTVFLYGQERKKGAYVGLTVYPNISNGFADIAANDAEYYQGIRSTDFSFSVGFKFNYQFKHDLGIASGLNYMKTGDRSLVYPPDPNRGLFLEREYKHREHYLELPLNMYKIFKEHWILNIGGSFLYNVGHRAIIYFDGSSNGLKNDVREYEKTRLGITANMGFGYVMKIGGIYLEFMPYVQYNFFRPMNDYFYTDHTPSRNFGSAGIQVNYLSKAKNN